jgi:uncharacterized protein (UPF0333 family)
MNNYKYYFILTLLRLFQFLTLVVVVCSIIYSYYLYQDFKCKFTYENTGKKSEYILFKGCTK